MMKFVLGLLIGAGIAFTVLAIIEKEEQRKLNEWEEWRRKLP